MLDRPRRPGPVVPHGRKFHRARDLCTQLRNHRARFAFDKHRCLPKGTCMHMPDLFLARASECESMAKTAPDPASRETWMRMASRWHRCAEIETHVVSLQHTANLQRHRKQRPAWSQH